MGGGMACTMACTQGQAMGQADIVSSSLAAGALRTMSMIASLHAARPKSLFACAAAACLAAAGASGSSTVPTPRQHEYMDMGFTQFMHFSVTTFGKVCLAYAIRAIRP